MSEILSVVIKSISYTNWSINRLKIERKIEREKGRDREKETEKK